MSTSGANSVARHEREYIEYVLSATGGNISEAARRLGYIAGLTKTT